MSQYVTIFNNTMTILYNTKKNILVDILHIVTFLLVLFHVGNNIVCIELLMSPEASLAKSGTWCIYMPNMPNMHYAVQDTVTNLSQQTV